MNDSDFQQLLASVKETGRIKRGEQEPARRFEVRSEDVKAIRAKLLAETDRYVADLVAEVGPPTAAQRTRAAAVARRLCAMTRSSGG